MQIKLSNEALKKRPQAQRTSLQPTTVEHRQKGGFVWSTEPGAEPGAGPLDQNELICTHPLILYLCCPLHFALSLPSSGGLGVVCVYCMGVCVCVPASVRVCVGSVSPTASDLSGGL